jgi:hypothetical protein
MLEESCLSHDSQEAETDRQRKARDITASHCLPPANYFFQLAPQPGLQIKNPLMD